MVIRYFQLHLVLRNEPSPYPCPTPTQGSLIFKRILTLVTPFIIYLPLQLSFAAQEDSSRELPLKANPQRLKIPQKQILKVSKFPKTTSVSSSSISSSSSSLQPLLTREASVALVAPSATFSWLTNNYSINQVSDKLDFLFQF